MQELQRMMGYKFNDVSLLNTALTHSSYANERKSVASNERLEFLGDSILGNVVAEYLYHNRPDMQEGRMTRLRAELVCERMLATAASELDIGECLLLGRGEEATGGRLRASILADAMEAVFAAVFLDGGRDAAEALITRLIISRIGDAESASRDYKTALQELCQKSQGNRIAYTLIDTLGPDHDKTFRVEVTVGGVSRGFGEGRTKKLAEQLAAKIALAELGGGL